MVGLALVVFVVALVALHPSWSHLAAEAGSPRPPVGGNWGTYRFFAVYEPVGVQVSDLSQTALPVAQYFGWTWGKAVRPRTAARFHTVVPASVLVGTALLLTTIDPVQLTEYSLVFSAVALPLTYLPILIVTNDRASRRC